MADDIVTRLCVTVLAVCVLLNAAAIIALVVRCD